MGKADPQKSEIVLYQSEDGRTRLEVKLENETVWLTQGQMKEGGGAYSDELLARIREVSLLVFGSG